MMKGPAIQLALFANVPPNIPRVDRWLGGGSLR